MSDNLNILVITSLKLVSLGIILLMRSFIFYDIDVDDPKPTNVAGILDMQNLWARESNFPNFLYSFGSI